MRNTRPIGWVKGALRDFQRFPEATQGKAVEALTIVADGAMPGIAKPLAGLGSGVWELVLRERGDAYRVVYALQLGEAIYVVHAFQKKSKSGIATPKAEIDLVAERIKRLKEELKQ